MADIKQAAEWMKEGKKVRRKSAAYWTLWMSSDISGIYTLQTTPGFSPQLDADDLLADDWEEK